MNLVDIQIVSQSDNLPSKEQFQFWIDTVLTDNSEDSEIVIRVIDETEMIQLNEQYRNKKGATNILSFPFHLPDEIESNLLGDLLICAPIVEKEALSQHKKSEHHWAHITIHGLLHLLGYDHVDNADAKKMEALEIKILKKIKITNPYEEKH